MTGGSTREYAPSGGLRERYAELLAIYRKIYPRLREIYSALAATVRSEE
jgi:hypothetical protein